MRIASLSPAVTEILFALEQQKKIVCRSNDSDFPDATAVIPALSMTQDFDPEALRAYTPDIVFTALSSQKILSEKIKAAGFGVVHQEPASLTDLTQCIRQIGMIIDCQARAEALIGAMQQGFNDTKRKAGLFPRRPKVYVEVSRTLPTMSDQWIADLVKIGGGVPFPEVGKRSIQDVQAFDPDVIVLCTSATGDSSFKEKMIAQEGWKSLRAVLENHVFTIDEALLLRPGPRLTEGVKRIFGWCFQVMH